MGLNGAEKYGNESDRIALRYFEIKFTVLISNNALFKILTNDASTSTCTLS